MPAKKKSIVDFLAVKEFIGTIAGESAIDLIKICHKKNCGVTDEEIAKKLGLKVTEIRTILNRLHYRGIVCYDKTKNKKTGWYSYTWEIKTKRIAELILEQNSEQIQKLENKMVLEETYSLFGCKAECATVPFEIAAEYHFKCPECGKTLESIDNKKRAKQTKKYIDTLKEEAAELAKML
ncbi:MAG: hypothetical protein V1672_05675 [Candidatus Diapherotrites archaeon]